jgi:hypothetical protein
MVFDVNADDLPKDITMIILEPEDKAQIAARLFSRVKADHLNLNTSWKP